MKKILYIIVVLLFSVTAKAQTYVADTTDLKLIPSVNNGKVAFIVGTDYQGAYRATQSDQTPNSATVFASFKSGWYWVKIQETELVDATRYGMKNDGTSISLDDFTKFCANTKNKLVYWPAGTYTFASNATDISPVGDIDWYGDGRNTILDNFEEFSPIGNIRMQNMQFIDADEYSIRWDSTETSQSDTVESVELYNLYMRDLKGFFRQPEQTSDVFAKVIKLNNIQYDTIGSGGTAFNFSFGTYYYDIQNVIIQHTKDSTWAAGILLASENSAGNNVDTTMYVNNIVFNGLWSKTSFGNPNSIYNLYCESDANATLKISNVKIFNTNLPRLYLRGSCPTEFENIEIRSTSTRSGNAEAAIISKARVSDPRQYSLKMKNIVVEVDSMQALYRENQGSVFLEDIYLKNTVSTIPTFSVSIGETITNNYTFKMLNSVINNTASLGVGFSMPPGFYHVELSNIEFKSPNITLATTNTGDTTDFLAINDCFFNGSRWGAQSLMYVNNLSVNGGRLVSHGVINAQAIKSSIFRGVTFESISPDTTEATTSAQDFAILSPSRYLEVSDCYFNQYNVTRMFNQDVGTADTIVFNYNRFYVNPGTSSGGRMIRIDTCDYLEMIGNKYFGTGTPAHMIFLENGIARAKIQDNTIQPSVANFIEGLSGANISNLQFVGNVGYTSVADGNTTLTYADYVVSQSVDEDGNAYLTTATGYTQTEIDSALISPTTEIKTADYELTNSDAGKRLIFTSNATLTIPAGLTWDAGQQVEIIRSGAITLSTSTGGVTVNYAGGGTAASAAVTTAATFIFVSSNNYIRIGVE